MEGSKRTTIRFGHLCSSTKKGKRQKKKEKNKKKKKKKKKQQQQPYDRKLLVKQCIKSL